MKKVEAFEKLTENLEIRVSVFSEVKSVFFFQILSSKTHWHTVSKFSAGTGTRYPNLNPEDDAVDLMDYKKYRLVTKVLESSDLSHVEGENHCLVMTHLEDNVVVYLDYE